MEASISVSTLTIHPKELAEVFDNVHAFCHDKSTAVNDVVSIHWGDGKLTVHGRGRYTASREQRQTIIEPSNSEGSFLMHIEDTKQVASALKKVEGAGRAGTTVTMSVENESLYIRSGAEDLAILDDADPDKGTCSTSDSVGLWEEIDDVIASFKPGDFTALAFTRDLLQRVGKIRVGKTNQSYDVWDFALLRGSNTVAVKFGPNWVGLIEAVWREGYEEGGRYGDGPGEKGSLW
ncbi:hypothetical protein [Glutamicibacter creatinolyticus]|uniref:hypothetical protein n=1 Tax=Glutamicibacter creatinolyticus TaxID=162496 RepID=UPI003216A243